MEVGEDDISGQRIERLVKLVQIPGLPGDMKFHHRRIPLMFHNVNIGYSPGGLKRNYGFGSIVEKQYPCVG